MFRTDSDYLMHIIKNVQPQKDVFITKERPFLRKNDKKARCRVVALQGGVSVFTELKADINA